MKLKIIIYSIISLVILYFSEQIFMLPYITKTIIKIPIFFLIPIIYSKYNLAFKIKKLEVKYILLFSLFIFSIIMSAYYILKPFIDINAISYDFSNRMLLDKSSIIIAIIYTLFINSFIEEIFFRGFIFQGLLNQGWNKRAYIFSSSLFAVYHIAIFKTWFNINLILLILVGLFIGGIIFSYFVKRTKSFLSSWIIHMSADLAIIMIGIKILKVFN